jgi:hypothetical protein
MSEFRINKHLSLKLEEGKTIIYVNNERFRQCKYLLLNIHIDKISTFDEIQSIDEASVNYNKFLNTNQNGILDPIEIPPEVEFWGHCSNLQVWTENLYDTRLLHRNLAFPLLNKLSEVGDPLARVVFREEIIKRFSSGERTVMQFLMSKRYFEMLDEEDLEMYFFSMPRLFKDFFVKLRDEKDKEIREEIENDLYYLLEILSKTDRLLDKLVMDRKTNVLRCLFKILTLTPIDGETIVLISELFEKINTSSDELSDLLEKEIFYQFNNGSSKIILELMLDRFFEYLNNSSVEFLFSNSSFTDNINYLVDYNTLYIIDCLIEFFIVIHDEIDKQLIHTFLKSMPEDTKKRLKEQIKERVKFYSTRDINQWGNKDELIRMLNILLKLVY